MTAVRIRRARPDDAEAVRRVARESWTAAYDDVLDDETIDRKLDEWYDVDALAASIEDDEGAFLVAEARDDENGDDARDEGDENDAPLVGFAQAGPAPADDAADGAYVLFRIYLRPDRWGEGIGTRLLDQAIGAIRAAGAETLRLAVWADNDVGVAFYEARGFERVREKTSDAGDEYVYVREI